MHERVKLALERVDNPDLLICNEEWHEGLSNKLLNRDGYIERTDAYGLHVIIDDRFPCAVVVEFSEKPCITEEL